MGMFTSPFPPIAASPSTDGRDLQLGHRGTSHRRKGAGARSVAETTHPRALLVRWTRLPTVAEPARSTRCAPSPGSMLGLVSAGPLTHVGDPVDKTSPPTRQPVAPRAPNRACPAARRADGDLPFGRSGFRRSAVRGRVPSQSNSGIAIHRRARVDRARNPLHQHQRPSDEPLTVPVATTWADFASSRVIGPTEIVGTGRSGGVGGRRRRVARSLNRPRG